MSAKPIYWVDSEGELHYIYDEGPFGLGPHKLLPAQALRNRPVTPQQLVDREIPYYIGWISKQIKSQYAQGFTSYTTPQLIVSPLFNLTLIRILQKNEYMVTSNESVSEAGVPQYQLVISWA